MFLKLSILTGMKWHFIVVCIYLALKISDVGHFFINNYNNTQMLWNSSNLLVDKFWHEAFVPNFILWYFVQGKTCPHPFSHTSLFFPTKTICLYSYFVTLVTLSRASYYNCEYQGPAVPIWAFICLLWRNVCLAN